MSQSELPADAERRSEPVLAGDSQLSTPAVDPQSHSTDPHGESSKSPRPPAVVDNAVPPASRYTTLHTHDLGEPGEVVVARDELLQREVALKRLFTAQGGDSPERRRLVREAEITGQLDHPGIVPVHEVGADVEHGPYYAMRLVRGETLEQAIASHHQANTDPQSSTRSLRQLLERFISICNTVAFAHSREVIHCDLKPANVLIGEFGETLVVGWSLARRRSEPTDRDAGLADRHQRISDDTAAGDAKPAGVPAYMSPEQAAGGGGEVGIATDIYSLGAILYSVLTGVAPFLLDDQPESLERLRRGDFPLPQQWCPHVPRVLEAICLQAMALRPETRYGSARELARDVECWLADEPTSVSAESWLTRGRRWAHRHRLLASSLAAAGAVALCGSLVLLKVAQNSNEQLRQAAEQEHLSRRTASRNAGNASFHAALVDEQSKLALHSLQTVTFEIQRELTRVPAAHAVRRKLLHTALQGLSEIGTKLEQRPQVDQGLMTAHRDLGDIFFEVGDLEGGSGTAAAKIQFQLAREIAEQLTQAQPANAELQRQLAICLDRLADVETRGGSKATARELYERSLAIRRGLLAAAPQDRRVQRDIAVSQNRLGDLALSGGQTEEARGHFQASVDARGATTGEMEDDEAQRDQMLSYHKLGEVTLRLGDAHQAEQIFQRGLTIGRQRLIAAPTDVVVRRDVATSLDKLGGAWWTLGDYARAQQYFGESLAIAERLVADDPENLQFQRDLAQTLQSAADVERKLLHSEQANRYAERMVGMLEKIVVADPQNRGALRDLALAYSTLAEPHLERQDYPAAIDLLRRSLAIRRQRAASDPTDKRGPSDVAAGMTKLGDGLLAAGQTTEALELFDAALKIHQQRCDTNPTDVRAHYNLAAFHQRIGVSCRRTEQFDTARKHYDQAMHIANELATRDPHNMQVRTLIIGLHDALGLLEQSRGRLETARMHFENGLAIARELIAAGKLTGDDATWDQFITDHLKVLPAAK